MIRALLCIACGLGGCAAPSAPRAVGAADAARAPPPTRPVQRYRIDVASSKVTAVATATVGRYTFRFTRFSGSVDWVVDQPERSRVRIDVDMRSVTGSVAVVTDVVRSPDFLDVERFPSARFESFAFTDGGEGRGRVRGSLLLHGVSRSIEVPGSFRFDGDRLALRSEFVIDRHDFAIENDGLLDSLVHDDVLVRLELRAVRAERTPLRAPAPEAAHLRR